MSALAVILELLIILVLLESLIVLVLIKPLMLLVLPESRMILVLLESLMVLEPRQVRTLESRYQSTFPPQPLRSQSF